MGWPTFLKPRGHVDIAGFPKATAWWFRANYLATHANSTASMCVETKRNRNRIDTWVAVNSISFGLPHARCTPMGRTVDSTCGEPNEIKKTTRFLSCCSLLRYARPLVGGDWRHQVQSLGLGAAVGLGVAVGCGWPSLAVCGCVLGPCVDGAPANCLPRAWSSAGHVPNHLLATCLIICWPRAWSSAGHAPPGAGPHAVPGVRIHAACAPAL